MDSNNDSIYAIKGGDNSEILRGIEITFLGVDQSEFREGTFAGPPQIGPWRGWIDEWFEPVILPAFRDIYEATASMRHRDIAKLDTKLSRVFPAKMTEQSTAAAQVFRGSKAHVQHMAQWVRFEEKLSANQTPGHLPTLFAIQSALFNVPINSALISYGLAEWLGAKPGGNASFDNAFQTLRATIEKSGTGGLRVI